MIKGLLFGLRNNLEEKLSEAIKILKDILEYSPAIWVHPKYLEALSKARNFLEENENFNQTFGDDGK